MSLGGGSSGLREPGPLPARPEDRQGLASAGSAPPGEEGRWMGLAAGGRWVGERAGACSEVQVWEVGTDLGITRSAEDGGR